MILQIASTQPRRKDIAKGLILGHRSWARVQRESGMLDLSLELMSQFR